MTALAPQTSAGQPRLADNVLEELWFGTEDPERSEYEASRSLAAALGVATGLKPFPLVLSRALSLLQDPDAPQSKAVTLIEQDPALSSRLLRIANSALFAPSRPCAAVNEAILRLGNRNVSDILAGVAVFGMFSDVGGLGSRIRDHCAGVAAIARILAVEWRFKGVEQVFLSALLHDVGKLLMMQAGEPRYDQMEPSLLNEVDRVHLEERHLTGYDHAALGAHVIVKWQLSPEVARIVAWHHQPGRAFQAGGETALSVALIRIADRIELDLARGAGVTEGLIEALSRDESSQYANFSADWLQAVWEKLSKARSETLAALGSR